MRVQHHIVIVEDDPVTRAKLASYFLAEGYKVSEAGDGEQMRAIMSRYPADLLMIDINLPGEDGLKLTREQRERSDVGIILVTGRSDTIDRIVGLEIGADDYVTKPVEHRELLARVKGLLRRVGKNRLPQAASATRQFHGWTLEVPRRTLQAADGTFVELTGAEFKLLAVLTANPGQVLSRERLLHEISRREWDASDRTVDVLVRRLRRKLQDNPRAPRIIITSHGEGYFFAPDAAQHAFASAN
ncbi:two-component system response regulator TorR [Aquamicrobium terrae]